MLEEAIKAGVMLAGWNFYGFERWILEARFGLKIPVEQMTDTMHRAAYAGLPRGLGGCAEALGLSASDSKDAVGALMMKKMASPRGYDSEGCATWWHETSPARLGELAAYCAQDVRAERAISALIPDLPLFEREIDLLHARINAAGLPVDLDFCGALEFLSGGALNAANEEVQEITGGAVTNIASQVNHITRWLGQFSPGSLRQEIVEKTLENVSLPAAERRVLELRLDSAKGSTKKIQKILQVTDRSTNRVHGVLAYMGANRTGRTSSKTVNFQNFPRPVVKEYDECLEDIAAGMQAHELAEKYKKGALQLVSGALRGIITAPEGSKFVIVDSAQIEARVLPWLAGQKDAIETFERGEDIYVHAATKLGSSDRNLGKVLTLACGFGMGGRKFKDTAARAPKPIILSDDEADAAVKAWRKSNPMIVKFWYETERVARAVIDEHRRTGRGVKLAANPLKNVVISCSTARNGKPLLAIELPSGRYLFYRNIEINASNEISYWGNDADRWGQNRTYSGKLVENIVQAVARDVVYGQALRVQSEIPNAEMVLAVHDEIVMVVDDDSAQSVLDRTEAIMSEAPAAWAQGLPLGAEGKIARRYGK
jgi:DNA polymerase